MRWNAFVLSLILSAAANSQPPLSSNGAGVAHDVAPLILRGVLGLSPSTTSLFMEQSAECVVNAPYLAVGDTESVTRFPDGNRIVQTTSIRYYRDSQGRTRTERPIPGTGTMVTVMINDIVGGQHYLLQPQAKIAQVMKTPAPIQTATRHPPVSAPASGIQFLMSGGLASESSASGEARAPAAPSNVSLGQQELEGLTTTGTRWEQTFAAGTLGNDKPITVTIEQWYSPDLGVIVFASQHTSTGAEMTYRLHNITRSEPDSALFTIPADYTRQEGMSMAVTAIRKD